MKKVLLIAALMCLVFSGVALATVVGTKHDMRSFGGDGSINQPTVSTGTTTQVCIFCHHPHRTGKTATEAAKLWNRADTTYSYTTYNGRYATDDADALRADNTDAHYSRICLSCHDSNNALTVVSTAPAGISGTYTSRSIGATAQANIGGDANTLQNDHPVDIDYSLVQAAATVSFRAITSGNITNGGRTWTLYTNTVQCSTCHDPHDSNLTGGVRFIKNGSLDPLNNSQMCVDCHIDK